MMASTGSETPASCGSSNWYSLSKHKIGCLKLLSLSREPCKAGEENQLNILITFLPTSLNTRWNDAITSTVSTKR